ncbi:hypothetical protein H6G65_02045 [Microcystis elabens FACHB-917]|nr:hypothetical protein [Microcystis elabens FACHB-917]
MFAALGSEARAAALNIIKQGRLEPWGSLDYHDATQYWANEINRCFSIETLLIQARLQEPLPRSPLLSDLDVFYDCPGLIYCLDYMQSRLHDGLSTTQDQRRALSSYIISFWSGALAQDKPDLIISQSPPHEIVDFALFILSLRHGIPWITLQYNPWGHRPVVLIADSHGTIESKPLWLTHMDSSSKAIQIEHVDQLLAEYRNPLEWNPRYDLKSAQANESKAKLMDYIKIALKASAKGLLLRNNANDRAYLQWLHRSRHSIAPIKEIDLAANYIYFPLNYQPELTTSPLAGIFCDQLSAVRALASALPEGWLVYVKEHPAQYLGHSYGYLGRSELFYKQLNGIHNVKLISSEIHSQVLIDGSELVATVTGSAGYESLSRSKCVIVFGEVWYQEIDGCFRVNRPSDVKSALDEARGYSINPRKVESQFHEIAQQSILFFGEELSALAFGYPWDRCREQGVIETLLCQIANIHRTASDHGQHL